MFFYKPSGYGFESRCGPYRYDRKQTLDAIDEITRKKVTDTGTPEPSRLQKVDSSELIEAICRIPIPGLHERRRVKVIRTVKTLDQLTEAMNYEGYELKCS